MLFDSWEAGGGILIPGYREIDGFITKRISMHKSRSVIEIIITV
jgi:hypothetical protein